MAEQETPFKTRNMSEPEGGKLKGDTQARCYHDVDGWDDSQLKSIRESVQHWLDGHSDVYYNLPQGSRPTIGDLNAIENEMRKRGLLK